ncbi:hypothetical protein EIP86_001683 [Pleurotus ostreatoroseus]|nr:hypothetical protein EIP86_001683 [Pleurotus ostreatoroseus]
MAMLFAIALSSFLFTSDPKGGITVTSLQMCASPESPNSALLNILADLTSLFNWNTKQLFLYVQAEYTNAQGVYNEVVIWDKIIRSKEEANLAVSGRNKYVFRNVGKSWKYVFLSPAP